MQINKINNSPAFGYDKQLNTQLIKRLAKEPQNDYVSETIKNLNNFCNNTEDMLKIYTAKENDRSEILLDTLLTSKIQLASLVDDRYPELNYSEREMKSYEKEADSITRKTKEKYPWQFSMSYELAELKQPVEIKETGNTVTDVVIKNPAIVLPKTECDIIEQFIPTTSSPEGFKSLGGLEDLKAELYDEIVYPARHPGQAELDYIEYGKRTPRGFLLYGPPGCGKTSTTEALSQEAGVPLFKLKISKAGSHYINQTSMNYEKAFEYVAECARLSNIPCIMMIDEIDGLTKKREREATAEDLKQIGTLLNLIETARDRNIIVIGATNKYDIVDSAVKRRFDRQLYLGLPDKETREQILQKTLGQWLKGKPLAQNPEDLKEIAEKAEGFPSSALVILADNASNTARKDGRRLIKKEDFFTEIAKNQNLKVNERDYKSKENRKPIGFMN